MSEIFLCIVYSLFSDFLFPPVRLLLFLAACHRYFRFDPENECVGLCICNNDNIFILKTMLSCTVECYLDGTVLPGMNGGFGKGGNRAATGSADIRDDQIRFSRIFKFEWVGNRFSLQNFPEIM